MAGPTQFRQYHISQDAEGNHVEVVRNEEQVAVLAFDAVRQLFVVCRVLLKPLKQPKNFADRLRKLQGAGLPRLARVFESGEDEGSTFYITTLVDGESLGDYLARQQGLPLELALALTMEALEGARSVLTVGDFILPDPLAAIGVVQSGATALELRVTDFRLNVEPGEKAVKVSALKAEFKSIAGLLDEVFSLAQRNGAGVAAGELAQHLRTLLQACQPGVEMMLEEWLGKCRSLAAKVGKPAVLEGALKPLSFLGPLLPGTQQVVQCAALQVRMQSQRVDAAQPYALTGVLMKSGQPVMVEPLPALALTGSTAAESLDEVRNLPKLGKFPNLVPVVFVEEHHGVRCVAEAAVNGVSLKELLEVRGKLDVQETYLVLAGVDAALTQLEKARVGVRRVRVEDVFLYTGAARESETGTELLTQKLNEWPGFSIVLRVHNSLHSMTGRGADPATLLPVQQGGGAGVEPVWHGGWLAALGGLITGMVARSGMARETGVAEVDTVLRLLDDELGRASRGEASGRAAFLGRFARVMQQFHLAQFSQAGGFWTELSGSASAQDRAAEVSREVEAGPAAPGKAPAKKALQQLPGAAPMLGTVADHEPLPQEEGAIGFAEMLIGNGQPLLDDVRQGGTSIFHASDDDVEDDYGLESSWVNLRDDRPLLVKLLMLLTASMILGAVLAHWSGRAIWQLAPVPVKRIEVPVQPPVKAEPVLDLPVPSPPKPAVPAARPAGSGASVPNPVESKPVEAKSKLPVPDPVPDPVPVPVPVPMAAPSVAVPAEPEDGVTKELLEARRTGQKLSAGLRDRAASAAAAGNAEAMLATGQSLLNGDAGRVDEQAGMGWLEKAAKAGNAQAMVSLADLYLQGRGAGASAVRAVEWLQAAADEGLPEAKDKLSVCYARGIGTAKDDVKAFRLSEEAYRAGVTSARGNLGAMYLRGQGVAPDAERAVLLFTEGAQLGHAESMLALAQCLEYGNGTRVNLEQATQWYRAAARKGNAEALRWCSEKRVAY
jgi:TPR repeat protein